MTEIEIFCHLPRFLAEIEHVLFAGNLICLFTLCSNSNLSSPSKLVDFCQIRRPLHMKLPFLCADVLTIFVRFCQSVSLSGLNIDRLYAIKRPFHFHADRSSSAWARRCFLRFNAVPVLNGAFLAGDVTQRKDLEQHRVFNQNESVH